MFQVEIVKIHLRNFEVLFLPVLTKYDKFLTILREKVTPYSQLQLFLISNKFTTED